MSGPAIMHDALAKSDDATFRETARSFRHKSVLLTGATSGIGRASALAFARRGASVAIVGRSAERGRDAAAACEAAGGPACFIEADVTNPEELRRAVTRTCERFGRLDIAFNNAGMQERRALVAKQSDEIFDAVFNVNVRAVFQAMKAEIAAMLQSGGGVIVNNASVSGLRNPNPGLAIYSASKAAVLSLTRSAALDQCGLSRTRRYADDARLGHRRHERRCCRATGAPAGTARRGRRGGGLARVRCCFVRDRPQSLRRRRLSRKLIPCVGD
jgi:NADP-dependent 3-hydroxy acid dehydrogenase YdfG